MSAKKQLEAVKEAIARKVENDAMIAKLPPITQKGTRFFIFFSGKVGEKDFDLPLWKLGNMTLAKNDALAKLLTNQPSDKICWDNLEDVASFMTSNGLDNVYTLHIADKNSSVDEAKAADVYMSVTKRQVFDRMATIAASVNASCDAVESNSPNFRLVSKHGKRDTKATTKGMELPEGLSL